MRKCKRLALLIVILMAVFHPAVRTLAAEDPAPAKNVYEFDGIDYLNLGSQDFKSNQAAYYRAMLENKLGVNGADTSSLSRYSISDLWTWLGVKALQYNNRTDSLGKNFFTYLGADLESGEHTLNPYYDQPYTAPNSPNPQDLICSERIDKDFHGDTFGISGKRHVVYFRDRLQAASNQDNMAQHIADIADHCISQAHDPVQIGTPDTPYTVKRSPDLNGPIYYTNVGVAGEELALPSNPFAENNNKGYHFYSVVAAFSNFTITPIIPGDENAYVITKVGSPTSNNKKTVSDVKNLSRENATASQSVSESTSTTIGSSISGSETYSLSTTVKVGGKASFLDIFEASAEVSTTITNSVTKGWSKSESETTSDTKTGSITVVLPAHTTVLMSQDSSMSQQEIRYNCPVALNYSVDLFYVYGKRSGSHVDLWFDKLTSFGESSNAINDLSARYTQSAGSAQMADKDGINWQTMNYDYDLKAAIAKLASTAPFDVTDAVFTQDITSIKTDVYDILPIYPIDTIKPVNPESSYLTNQRWKYEYNMTKGDVKYTSNIELKALNKFGADFYTFYKKNGHFIVVDKEGNPDTSGKVIKLYKDAASGLQKYAAVGEGTAYLKYIINEDIYRTANMAAIQPDTYITNKDINTNGCHTAVIQINVSKAQTHSHTWLKPIYTWSADYSTCTAERTCKENSSHVERETVNSKIKSSSAACTTSDKIIYTADFENPAFASQTKTVSKESKGHKWGAWTRLDDKKHKRICVNNQIHIETVAHVWDSGVMTKAPATTSKGVITYTCKTCGAKKTEAIAALKKVKVLAKTIAKGKNKLLVSWYKVDGADGYKVYMAPCDSYEAYSSCKLVKTIKNNNTFRFKKSGLKSKKAYKAYVAAFKMVNGKAVTIGKSLMTHAITGNFNKKYSNVRKIVLRKTKITLRKGGKYKIKNAKLVLCKKGRKPLNKDHSPKFRYYSNRSKIAKVSSKGTITALKPGKCRIYVIAVNGVSEGITVRVK